MAKPALRLLEGGVPDQHCSNPCSIESTVAPPADHPKMFGPVRVQPIDSSKTASGHAQLRITLPLNPGFNVQGVVRARCKVGGLPTQTEVWDVSADAIIVHVCLPDGIDLWQSVPIELTWICSSRFIPTVTFKIRGCE